VCWHPLGASLLYVTPDDPRTTALHLLPRPYALALRLRDEGLSVPRVAEVLGIEPEAVGPLLLLAEAKLATLLKEC